MIDVGKKAPAFNLKDQDGNAHRLSDYAGQPGPPETFESNIVTHDRKRWQLQRDLIAAAPEALERVHVRQE